MVGEGGEDTAVTSWVQVQVIVSWAEGGTGWLENIQAGRAEMENLLPLTALSTERIEPVWMEEWHDKHRLERSQQAQTGKVTTSTDWKGHNKLEWQTPLWILCPRLMTTLDLQGEANHRHHLGCGREERCTSPACTLGGERAPPLVSDFRSRGRSQLWNYDVEQNKLRLEELPEAV